MAELEVALSKVDGHHKEALLWFNDFRGQRVAWAEIKEHAILGARLVNQAKGIYKPAYTDFALSVRTIQDGPYPDKEVEYRPDESFNAQNNSDLWEKQFVTVAVRRGQSSFRLGLLGAYQGRYCITGCDLVDAL